jgi:hypothetical protein
MRESEAMEKPKEAQPEDPKLLQIVTKLRDLTEDRDAQDGVPANNIQKAHDRAADYDHESS